MTLKLKWILVNSLNTVHINSKAINQYMRVNEKTDYNMAVENNYFLMAHSMKDIGKMGRFMVSEGKSYQREMYILGVLWKADKKGKGI